MKKTEKEIGRDVVLHNGEIVNKESVYEDLVTGLNEVVEVLGYDVDVNGFGYSEEGLGYLCGDNIDSFEEGFDWLIDELSGGYGSGQEGVRVVEGLNIAMRALGFAPGNGSEFVFEGIDEIYYMDNGNKTSIGDGLEALRLRLFEVGFLEMTSDAISFSVEGNSYVVGWEKKFPDTLSFSDIMGDYSIMGSKEEIVEELHTIKNVEAVIQEFEIQADVLLNRHASECTAQERPDLEEQILKVKEQCDRSDTGRDIVNDKDMYR